MRERMAYADLIPGDILPVRGYLVVGYPHGGPLGRTWVPVDSKGGYMKILVPSEDMVSIIR